MARSRSWLREISPHNHGVVVACLTSSHIQTSLFGSSGIPFAFHTAMASSVPALPLHAPRRASFWLVWCSFSLPHSQTSQSRIRALSQPSYAKSFQASSTNKRSPNILLKRLILCKDQTCLLSTQPRCRRRPPYLFKHPDEPLWFIWCFFCFPHSHGVVGDRLISPHTQTSLFGSSGVLFAFHTSMASSSSTLPQTSSSGIIFTCFTSPHIWTSLIDSSGVNFAFHTVIVLSLPALPLHTSRRASLARLVLFFAFNTSSSPTIPLHTAIVSSSPALPLHTSRRASLARLVLFFAFHTSSSPTIPLHTPRRAPLAHLASSSPALPLHTSRRASLAHLVFLLLSTQL
jgi:hypothetical protein